jgi:CheY-like chemotaxis protein/HPt (histidine-containing phosphotransfer) domain-containing protein
VEADQRVEAMMKTLVLLAEDDYAAQRVVAVMLERLGCEVLSAGDGQEAVARWADHPVDLVLMDCQMPGMDGVEATRELRRRERDSGRRRIPVLAMTATVLPGDRERWAAAEMDDHLAKPVAREALARALAHWVGTEIEPEARGGPTAERPEAVHPASLDGRALEELRKYVDEGIDEIVSTFLEQAPLRIGQIAHSAGTGDARALFLAAHALKSSSALVGAVMLSEVAERLELIGKQGRVEEAGALIAVVQREFAQVEPALRSLLP